MENHNGSSAERGGGSLERMVRRIITQADLREALRLGYWTVEKDSAFYIKRYYDSGDLKRPSVVVKAGTVVHVNKVYRRGRAALLCYIDRSGKVWWSWTHATEYERRNPPNVRMSEGADK